MIKIQFRVSSIERIGSEVPEEIWGADSNLFVQLVAVGYVGPVDMGEINKLMVLKKNITLSVITEKLPLPGVFDCVIGSTSAPLAYKTAGGEWVINDAKGAIELLLEEIKKKQ